MKILNLQQGTSEWHQVRATRFTASEAPAMMGVSKYQSRSQLLHQKATGLAPEVSDHQQRIFNRGHAAEEAARPIAEKIIGEALYPVTCEDDDGRLLASMDGLTMLEDIGFEHKLWNEQLAEQVRAEALEPHYTVQMDQQLLVSGADKILFMCSDGTEENCEWMWYERNEAAFKALEAGWEQFAKDLSEYQAPEVEQPKAEGKAPDALPALSVQVQGMVTASNLREFEESARATLAAIKTDLQTDSDFANAEQTVKFCKEVEKRLDGTKENVLGQMQTVDEVVKTIDRIKEETRQIRLKLNKAVTEQKEQRKAEILKAANEALQKHLCELENALESEAGGLPVPVSYQVKGEFAGAMKGKKTMASLKSACDDELARAKIEANELAELIRTNIAQLNEHAPDHRFLFRDFDFLCIKSPDDFAAAVKMRIADYQAEQEAKAKREAEAAAQREAAEKAKAEQAQPEAKKANPLTDCPPIRYEAPEDGRQSMPSPQEIVQVVADHYGVSFDQAMAWMASYEFRRAA